MTTPKADVPMMVRFPRDLIAAARRAMPEGMTFSAFVRVALTEAVRSANDARRTSAAISRARA